MGEIWSLIRAIVFETILRLFVHSQKTRYLPERASCLQTQTHHLIIHDYTAVSLACLPVSYCWPFAWVHRTSSEVCLVHQALYILPSCIISSLPVSKAPSKHGWYNTCCKIRKKCEAWPLWGQMWINESTVKHLNYFYNRIILVLLYQNDVKVNSGLNLYMYMHFDIHICGTSF